MSEFCGLPRQAGVNFTQGCGLFAPPEGARLTLEVRADNSTGTLNEVVLRGDRQGLRALAAAILATVESPVKGFHMHVDADVNGPVFRSPQGFTLTIDRFEKWHDHDWSQWSKQELIELVRAMDDEECGKVGLS